MHLFTENELKCRDMVGHTSTYSIQTVIEEEDSTFTPDEIVVLRAISVAEKKDATFVRVALEMQYKDELEKLSQRSVKGNAESVRKSKGVDVIYAAKLPLSPEKVNPVRARYNERIRENCVDSLEFSKRFSDVYFNKLLNITLSNHGRKRKANENVDLMQYSEFMCADEDFN